MTTSEVRADAFNRGLRSLLQGLGIDILVAVCLVLGTFVLGISSWGEVQWGVLSFTLVKSLVQAVVSYVMRRFANRSLPIALQAPE